MEFSPVEVYLQNPYLVRKSSSTSKNCRCEPTVYTLCGTVNDEPASPRPGPLNPVLAIAMAVAGSCSSFLARLNGANKPTGRTAEAPRPMGSSREGSLPRQNWVSVNSAGAFPASQYFLPGLAPWSPGPVPATTAAAATWHSCSPNVAVRLRIRRTVFPFFAVLTRLDFCRILAASLPSISSQGKHTHRAAAARRRQPRRADRDTQSPYGNGRQDNS